MRYRYYGLTFGKFKVALALLHTSALLVGSHAAVWLGVSNPSATHWVQAGIADSEGQRFDYIEIHTPRTYSLQRLPYTPRAHIHLYSHGGDWRVVIDHVSSRLVWVPHWLSMTTLETYGTTGLNTARINGRIVYGF